MSCEKSLASYRQRILDIAETRTGKKILESMKKISERKGSDYLMKHEEVSKESGIKDSRVENMLEKFSEVEIVTRKPVYVDYGSIRKVYHNEYSLPEVSVKKESIILIVYVNQKN